MQRERRKDPYPWTWEPPALIIVSVVLTMAVGVQAGRGLANFLAGAGWTWPDTQTSIGFSSPLAGAFWSSLPGVVGGDAAAGLATPVPDYTAGPLLLWVCLGIAETALMVPIVAAIVFVLRRWGSARMRGMATTAEAESLLGISRLRKVAPVVRPDLYSPRAAENVLVHHDVGQAPQIDSSTAHTLHEETSPWLLRRLTRKNR